MRRSADQFGWFHITNRGVDRQDIFVDDIDRDRFIELLVESGERFDVEIHAYCLMSNHFHLIVNSPDGRLSDFLQRLEWRYALHHNRRVARVGHLFSGRFRSTVLDEEATTWETRADQGETLQVVARYVHRNLLDAMPLVAVRRNRFSSYGCYLGTRATPRWLHADRLLALHDGDRRALQAFTERQHPSDKTPGGGRDVVAYSWTEVIVAVASTAGVSVAAVEQVVPGCSNRLRDLAAHLCVVLRTGDSETLAQAFRVASQAALRRLAACGKDQCGADPELHRLRDRVLAELWRSTHAQHRDAA